MNTITFEGEENIQTLAAVLIMGIACLVEGKDKAESVEGRFCTEVLAGLESMTEQIAPLQEIGAAANKRFMKKAMQALMDELDNPPPPKKSRWQERLEEVQSAQKEARERREKSSNIQKKYNFEP